MRDLTSLLVGVVAIIAAGLVLLDQSGAVKVDEIVALASFWIGLAAVGAIRSVIRLLQAGRPASG